MDNIKSLGGLVDGFLQSLASFEVKYCQLLLVSGVRGELEMHVQLEVAWLEILSRTGEQADLAPTVKTELIRGSQELREDQTAGLHA